MDVDKPQQFQCDDLLRSVYDELRRLARARLDRFHGPQTLQATDLVHEAYVRLKEKNRAEWNSRGHFFAAAARAMRDVLVNRAREKGALKRGGDQVRMDITVTWPDSEKPLTARELLDLHDALEKLQVQHPEHAEVVFLHCFAGMTLDEISEIFEVSRSTTERRWRFARAWLYDQMAASAPC
ncbi:MAG: ECF-type sigma factor [Proteobacteria bacterium]|nr:ECF-type sigma factor [Pseudomonadota bacterium]